MLSSLKMPLSEALAVSAIGISTVIIILAIIALLIILVSKAIRAIEAKATKAPEAAAPVTAAMPAVSQGQVELIDTDEKEAAVIMAIVSNKTGIPLERLSFKSIKLIDEKKGDK